MIIFILLCNKILQLHIWTHRWPHQESLIVIVRQYYTLVKFKNKLTKQKSAST